jgi:molybdopterin-guanine dinucleotide biosynthesis protein A
MGRDKAFIEIDGRTLLERAVSALDDAGLEPVIVVGGDTDAIARLGLTAVADRHPGEGPLGGVITALEAVSADTVMILSCDLTDASSIAVGAVIGALGDSDVAVPVLDGREQWLHTAWRRRALTTLEAAFDRGARSMRDGTEGLRVTRVLDGDPCWYSDADTPDDLPPRARR